MLTILLGERQTGRGQHRRPDLTVNSGAACHKIPLLGCLQVTTLVRQAYLSHNLTAKEACQLVLGSCKTARTPFKTLSFLL